MSKKSNLLTQWKQHDCQWRNPKQIISQWIDAEKIDTELFDYRVMGNFLEVLKDLKVTLLVTREYEHLIMAISFDEKLLRISYQPMPHPSGLVVDREQMILYVASTRNPNQIHEFEPTCSYLHRKDQKKINDNIKVLVPVRSRYYPGCMYFHDLAIIDNLLYANAVAHNAIVSLHPNGSYQRVWWPKCIEKRNKDAFSLNYLQLNSIAKGDGINNSFFSASTANVFLRDRPGHKNFRVNKQGVIFSAQSREPCVFGLTRPHSARMYREKLWVNNSGYGEFGYCEDGSFRTVNRLDGWTRGLCFIGDIAFVGTSRIIPDFKHYAPGLTEEKSYCSIYAVDMKSGNILGSLKWPKGNQIFAIDWISSIDSKGFPFAINVRNQKTREKKVFYSFETRNIRNKREV